MSGSAVTSKGLWTVSGARRIGNNFAISFGCAATGESKEIVMHEGEAQRLSGLTQGLYAGAVASADRTAMPPQPAAPTSTAGKTRSSRPR